MFLQFLRLDGKAFHTVGPAWKKARSPKASLPCQLRDYKQCFI